MIDIVSALYCGIAYQPTHDQCLIHKQVIDELKVATDETNLPYKKLLNSNGRTKFVLVVELLVKN